MINHKILYSVLAAVFSLMFLLSCGEDDECHENKYVVMNARFYRVLPGDDRSSAELAIDSLTVYGVGRQDSLLFNNVKGRNNMDKLPLNPLAEMTQFVFIANDTIDTINVYHTNIEEYLSLECGIRTTFKIEDVTSTHHYIDSIQVRVDTVNINNAEHIHIYHNPRP